MPIKEQGETYVYNGLYRRVPGGSVTERDWRTPRYLLEASMGIVALTGLIEKLRLLGPLSIDDERRVTAIQVTLETIARHRDAACQGADARHVWFVQSGWLARYGVRGNGTRRITGFLLPGDFCGIHALANMPLDHSVVALENAVVAKVELAAINELLASVPNVARALWRAKQIDEAILRKWLLNSAASEQAVAHLLCELWVRAELSGERRDDAFHMPLTQEAIGDAIGITSVHVNRMMRRLRESGLIAQDHQRLTILDWPGLARVGEFDPAYLAH